MAVSPPVCDFGLPAVDFLLPGTDGRNWSFEDVAGPRGTLIMFICNHCPYVKGIIDRIIRDARDLQALGVGVAAISSNDPISYPEDGFDEMRAEALAHSFPFPYLFYESQEIAMRYGAVCTPDFFGYNAARELQYRGRLDASGRQPAEPSARRDLFEAMKLVAQTGHGPVDQIASMGCSIKWKA